MERAKRPYEGSDAYEAGKKDAEQRLRETSEWVWNENAIDWELGAWVCRICGCRNDNIPHQAELYPYSWAGTKYCPNCGRRMLPSNILCRNYVFDNWDYGGGVINGKRIYRTI